MRIDKAIQSGWEPVTYDGNKIKIIDFDISSGTQRHMLGITYFGKEEATIKRIGFFDKITGRALTIIGAPDDLSQDICIRPVEKDCWFIRYSTDTETDIMVGSFPTKYAAEARLKVLRTTVSNLISAKIEKLVVKKSYKDDE